MRGEEEKRGNFDWFVKAKNRNKPKRGDSVSEK